MKKQLLLKTFFFFYSAPLVAASDESIHSLNTSNTYLIKVNNRNTEKYEICSNNEGTKTTACYYHVTFQSESTLYSCLNVSKLLARNRRHMLSLSDCKGIRTYNHLFRKRTLNNFAKLDVVIFSSLVTLNRFQTLV